MERSVDILNELKEISPRVAGIGRANVFFVLEGYFDTIPEAILARVKNDVPAEYFDILSNNILAKIEGTAAHELQEISPFMAGIKKVTPYEVPANYFEEVPESTVAGVNENNISGILQGANKLQPFTIPAGYFEHLAGNILNKVNPDTGTKVIAMPQRRNVILKYAAAAVFTGMVALGVYKYAGDIKITASEAVVLSSIIEEGKKMDEKKFDEKLNSLAEEDIMKYLEHNGSEADVAVLTSGIEEGNVPAQEEYFTDDAAFEKFIEDINSTN